jgi:hypothetical protein
VNQSFSWAAFVGGLATFLSLSSEMLARHATWAELYRTPAGAAHLFIIGASFTACIGGALGVQLPRKTGADRKGDPPAGSTTTTVTTTEPRHED